MMIIYAKKYSVQSDQYYNKLKWNNIKSMMAVKLESIIITRMTCSFTVWFVKQHIKNVKKVKM